MQKRWIISSCLFLSGVMISADAATTAPVPTLTITRKAERRATPTDALAMEAASRDVNLALTQFRRAANEFRIAFETSAEFTAAVAAANDARLKLQSARQQAIASVRSTPEYLHQSFKIEKLEATMSSLRRENKTDQLITLAHDLLSERASLTKIEQAAMQNDPMISDLRQAYIDAAAQVTALRDNFAEELRRSPEWQQAKVDYDDAVRRRAALR